MALRPVQGGGRNLLQKDKIVRKVAKPPPFSSKETTKGPDVMNPIEQNSDWRLESYLTAKHDHFIQGPLLEGTAGGLIFRPDSLQRSSACFLRSYYHSSHRRHVPESFAALGHQEAACINEAVRQTFGCSVAAERPGRAESWQPKQPLSLPTTPRRDAQMPSRQLELGLSTSKQCLKRRCALAMVAGCIC